MKHLALYATSLVALCTLTACNTIKGAGTDLQGAGNWIVNSATTAEKNIEADAAPKGKYQYPGERNPSHIYHADPK